MARIPKHISDKLGPAFFDLAEISQDVFWIRSADFYTQVYASPAFERVWGRSCQMLYDNPSEWINAVVLEDRDPLRQRMMEWQANVKVGEVYTADYRVAGQGGKLHWINDTCYPMYKGNECIGYVGVAKEVNGEELRLKELNKQLREAKELAEQANRTKSDFLAMMSHELRTPLNAILGMTQILKSGNLSDEQSGQIDVITQAGQNLLGLLNDLLDFAKLEVGKLSFSEEAIDLREIVMSLKKDLGSQAYKKGIQLKFDYPDNVPSKIIGDAKRIRQILINLLSNAIKFTEKGHVQLTLHCPQKNHKKMTICFVVEDTGIGIEKSKLSSIFNRFQQVTSVYQRKYDGVGLGLSIVKELVERMGGTVTVSSEVDVGSQFTCVIPFRLRAETSMATQKARHLLEKKAVNNLVYQRPSDGHFNMNVLVVEDNLINQKISKIMLEQIGCRVDIADCAKDAIEKMKQHYDLVFMDIGLPDMDGFEAVQCIRSHEAPGQHVPIVAMTAHVFAHDRERCFDVGMDEVMAKPIMQDDLIKVLKRWAA